MSGPRRPEQDRDPGALDALGRAWARLDRAEPPELVDQAVLNAARRAVARPSPFRRWWGAFATAGVVVLALAVVLQQDWEAAAPPMEDLDLRPPQEPAARRTESDAAATELPMAETEQTRPQRMQSDHSRSALAEEAPVQRDRDDALSAAESRLVPNAAAEPGLGKEAESLSPEHWIERLRQLHAEGDESALRRELAAFRASYPDYPLPPDLEE